MSLEVSTTDSELSDEALAALASLLLDWWEQDELSNTIDPGQVDRCNIKAD